MTDFGSPESYLSKEFQVAYGQGSLFIHEMALFIFRAIICLTHLIFIVYPISSGTIEFGSTFAYLTMWGFYMCTFYMLVTILFRFTGIDKKVGRPMRYFFFMCLNAETVIAIFFWTVLYPGLKEDDKHGTIFVFAMIYPHTIPFASIWIDFFLNTWISTKRDMHAFLILGLIYMIVNCIVTFVSGTPVYPPIKYTDVWTYIFLIAALVLGLISFALSFLLSHKVKKPRIKSKFDDFLLPE